MRSSRPWIWCGTFRSITACSGRERAAADVVGIQFPGGKALGDPGNFKMRFDATFIQAGRRTASCTGEHPVRRLVNQRPDRGGMLVLSMLPFMLLIAAYLAASSARLAANPGDKLLPSPATFAATIHRYALEEDERTRRRSCSGATPRRASSAC